MHKELFLEKCLNLSDQSVVQKLLEDAQTIHVKQNSLLIEAGEVQQRVLILVEGEPGAFCWTQTAGILQTALRTGRVRSSWDAMPWGRRR